MENYQETIKEYTTNQGYYKPITLLNRYKILDEEYKEIDNNNTVVKTITTDIENVDLKLENSGLKQKVEVLEEYFEVECIMVNVLDSFITSFIAH